MKTRTLPVNVYFGLGANLGDTESTIQCAIDEIIKRACCGRSDLSSFYVTEPIDSSGPDYVNAVLCIETQCAPLELLRILQSIENQHGRVRPMGVVNAPRTLDCDLLLYGDERIETKDLIIPHARMHQRAFVLVPLLELNQNIEIPGLGLAKSFLPRVMNQRIRKTCE